MRIAVVAASVGLCIVGIANAQNAQAMVRQATAIAAQPLDSALRALAKERGFHIVYFATIVNSLRTQGAAGVLSRDEALTQLLAGTGLTFRYLDDETVTIVSAAAAPAATGKGSGNTTENDSGGADGRTPASGQKSFWSGRRLAQADSTGSGASSTAGPPEAAPDTKATQLEQVVITGSHIQGTAQQQAQPVITFTSQDIDRSGQASLPDFLNTLPQVSMNSISGPMQTFAGQQGVRLHGLPLTATLTLIDGQSIQLGDYGPLDLNLIPTSVIERIDIIPVGSSAVYGSDALAGVVNIVTKKNLEGLQVDTRYGSADNYNDKKFDVAYGKLFQDGSFSVAGTYQRNGGLALGDRDLKVNLSYPYCNPGTVYATGGGNLPGLGAGFAAIPAGLSGTPTIGAFAATAGTTSKCNYYGKEDVVSPQEELGVLANGHWQIAPAVDVFASVLYSHLVQDNITASQLSLSHTGYTVGASNPYNPFGAPVGVDWSWGTFDYERIVNFLRPTLGVRGDLGGDWHYDVTTLYSLDHFTVRERRANTTAVQQALNSSDPADALNVFTSGDPGSTQLLDSLFTTLQDEYRDALTSAQAVLNGPLFTLPAGKVKASVGADYQRSTIYYHLVNGNAYGVPSSSSRNLYALFTEARVPLLAGSRGPGEGELLALSGAARYDHSSDFGGKATYQGGLEFRPVHSLLLRGAFGTSYRAPSLTNLYGALTTYYTTTVTDPYRGNSSSVVNYPIGPNTNLKPEEGNSTSFGFVYSSDTLRGLDVSLTYWKLHYDNYIGAAQTQDLVTYPQDYPSGWVVRAAPTAADLAKGWLGQIQSVYGGTVNFGKIDVNGFDFDAKYRIDTGWGTWTPALALTETNKYSAALRPGQAQASYVDQATTAPGWAPRWKGNASVSWGRQPWSVSATGRYLSSYNDYTGFTGPYPHELGDFWLFDASARFDLGKAFAREGDWWRGTYVSVGGTNLLNRQPQYSYYYFGFDFTQADVMGRYVYLQAGLKL